MTAAKTNDPVANSLLDFIGIDESDDNYEAYIGHIKPSAGTLTDLSIAQIYQFQQHLLDQGEPSSAVGKYQFVHTTLAGLIIKASIPLNAKFTPLVEDQLAMMLLTARGYVAWKAGRMSDQQFAHELSCEWASLPDPFNGGKSHYDGIGPNHARRTLASVYIALNAARTAK